MKEIKAENQGPGSQHEKDVVETLYSAFLSVQEVAVYLRVKPSTVYSIVEQRRIPHYRVGRQIRFRKSEVDQWIEERKEPVVDVKVEAKKVFRAIEKKADLDINRIVKKAVDGAKGKGYNSSYGKPDQIRGLGKEVSGGSL